LLAQNAGNSLRPSEVEGEAREIMNHFHTAISGMQQRLAAFAYPFPHALGKITVAEYLRNDTPTSSEWQRFYEEGRVHVNRWSALHYRLLGVVLEYANEAEPVFHE
jgi:hypothetical protein